MHFEKLQQPQTIIHTRFGIKNCLVDVNTFIVYIRDNYDGRIFHLQYNKQTLDEMLEMRKNNICLNRENIKAIDELIYLYNNKLAQINVVKIRGDN